jgi:hypothetical protein
MPRRRVPAFSHTSQTEQPFSPANLPFDPGEGLCEAGELCREDRSHAFGCKRFLRFRRQAAAGAYVAEIVGRAESLRSELERAGRLLDRLERRISEIREAFPSE